MSLVFSLTLINMAVAIYGSHFFFTLENIKFAIHLRTGGAMLIRVGLLHNSILTPSGENCLHFIVSQKPYYFVVLSRCRLLNNFKNRRKFEKIEVIRIVRFSVVNVWSGSVYQHKTGFPKLAGSRFCRNLKFSLMIDTLCHVRLALGNPNVLYCSEH